MIKFTINAEKALHTILYVVAKAGGRINKYNLLKVIFEADKYHLNKYGRPVTGDSYIKMKHGTVPSKIYDFIKVNPIAQSIGKLPIGKEKNDVFSGQPPNLDLFSESDIEAIDFGFEKYAHLDFGQVQDLNHKEKCWIDSEMNKPIPFDLMIENDEIRQYLEEHPFKVSI